jgi:NAD(P)H-hydrate epimerase
MSLSTYPILSCAEALRREAVLLPDAAAVTAAMTAAGAGIARQLLRDFTETDPAPPAPRVLLLAGKGHNAGDGCHALRTIARLSPAAELTILWAEPPERLRPHSAEALAALGNAATIAEYLWNEASASELGARSWDIVLDGLLGCSFSPPLRPPYGAIIAWANATLAPRTLLRAAIDLPSGLGDTCAAEPFAADFTYMTGFAKAPALVDGACAHTGRVRLVPITGFDFADAAAEQFLTTDSLAMLARLRPAAADKRTPGHVLVLAGSPNMPGAALMATLGAIRSGAGLVTTLAPAQVTSRLMAAAPEAMWQSLPAAPDGSLDGECVRALHYHAPQAQVLLVGPGLRNDRNTIYNVCRIVREIHLPLVIDATALAPDVIGAVVARPPEAGPVVVTPHLGEYRRLLANPDACFAAAEAQAWCRKYRLVLVLKGPLTRICDGDRLLHAAGGGPVLARGGSGDILAGMLAVQLARRPAEPLLAAAMAVTWHGAAAECLARARGHEGVRTTELLDYLAPALRTRL